jgi:small-conductance mechanosensitive channel
MTAPRDPGVPDIAALRRRVLMTAVLSMVLFIAAAYTVTALGVSDFWLLVLVVLIWVLVVRPLMRPVREVVALRRRLAYQAFLEQRREEQR